MCSNSGRGQARAGGTPGGVGGAVETPTPTQPEVTQPGEQRIKGGDLRGYSTDRLNSLVATLGRGISEMQSRLRDQTLTDRQRTGFQNRLNEYQSRRQAAEQELARR